MRHICLAFLTFILMLPSRLAAQPAQTLPWIGVSYPEILPTSPASPETAENAATDHLALLRDNGITAIRFVLPPTSTSLDNASTCSKQSLRQSATALAATLKNLASHHMEAQVVIRLEADALYDINLTASRLGSLLRETASLYYRDSGKEPQAPTLPDWEISLPLTANVDSMRNIVNVLSDSLRATAFYRHILTAIHLDTTRSETRDLTSKMVSTLSLLMTTMTDAVGFPLQPLEMKMVGRGSLFGGLAQLYIRLDTLIEELQRLSALHDKPIYINQCTYPRDGFGTAPETSCMARQEFWTYILCKLKERAGTQGRIQGCSLGCYASAGPLEAVAESPTADTATDTTIEAIGRNHCLDTYHIYPTDRQTLLLLQGYARSAEQAEEKPDASEASRNE